MTAPEPKSLNDVPTTVTFQLPARYRRTYRKLVEHYGAGDEQAFFEAVLGHLGSQLRQERITGVAVRTKDAMIEKFGRELTQRESDALVRQAAGKSLDAVDQSIIAELSVLAATRRGDDDG